MVSGRFAQIVLVVLFSGIALAQDAPRGVDSKDVLATYVSAADNAYAWRERGRSTVLGVEMIELTLTSQSWRGLIWKHRLLILLPSRMAHPKEALLVISGGSWRGEYDAPGDAQKVKVNAETLALAAAVGHLSCPIAILSNVPFQPLFGGKKEDALIAYTFDRFLNGGDATWPLLLPMVKSATRAMDAVQEFLSQKEKIEVKSFTVSGASKRGWTTWLTAAVDPRVIAAAPMVIDMLNMSAQTHHQLDVWGEFSKQIHDYTDLKIPQRMDSDRGRKLEQIVDPYAYRDKLTQPKLIFLGTNDPYWPVDASNLYWDGLKGEKYLTIVPNAGHDLGSDFQRILGSLAAIHQAASGTRKMPQLEWSFADVPASRALTIKSDQKPRRAQVWMAHSRTKDFRDAKWQSTALLEKNEAYEFPIPADGGGFVAVFGELVFEGVLPLHLATNIRIFGD